MSCLFFYLSLGNVEQDDKTCYIIFYKGYRVCFINLFHTCIGLVPTYDQFLNVNFIYPLLSLSLAESITKYVYYTSKVLE